MQRVGGNAAVVGEIQGGGTNEQPAPIGGYSASLNDLRKYDKYKVAHEIDPDVQADFESIVTFLQGPEVLDCLAELNERIGAEKDKRPALEQGTGEVYYECLNTVAQELEEEGGYSADVGLIKASFDDTIPESARKTGDVILRRFVKDRRPFLDHGVSVAHGADTHRIQQLLIVLACKRGYLNLKCGPPANIYKILGDPDYGVAAAKFNDTTPVGLPRENIRDRKLYAWELLLDRVRQKRAVMLLTKDGSVRGAKDVDAGIPVDLLHYIHKHADKYQHLKEAVIIGEEKLQKYYNEVRRRDSAKRQPPSPTPIAYRSTRRRWVAAVAAVVALGAAIAIARMVTSP